MWTTLKAHHAAVSDRRFETMLDTGRAADFSATAGYMRLDYAKTNIDAEGRALLLDLLNQTGVAAKRDAMFTGDPINETEGRAVHFNRSTIQIAQRCVQHGATFGFVDRVAGEHSIAFGRNTSLVQQIKQ